MCSLRESAKVVENLPNSPAKGRNILGVWGFCVGQIRQYGWSTCVVRAKLEEEVHKNAGMVRKLRNRSLALPFCGCLWQIFSHFGRFPQIAHKLRPKDYISITMISSSQNSDILSLIADRPSIWTTLGMIVG